VAEAVGVVGLGKLGLPVAVTLAMKGHKVLAYDRSPDRMALTALSPHERGPNTQVALARCVDESLPLRFTGLPELLAEVECVYVIVETPHQQAYEGTTPLPDSRSDFGYEVLVNAVADIVRQATHPIEIGIMSTVLPGTVRSRILPVTQGHRLVYCPQFAAMTTVCHDLQHAEFVLLGCAADDPEPRTATILGGLSDAPVFTVSYETAELAKVVYNTYVSAKVTVANLVQRLAHETGAEAADVFGILSAADRRLWSPAYVGPGMGDGGPCHPRDNIALSWLARRHGFGADLFTAVMESRQAYVEWLGARFVEAAAGRPMVLLGTAFKPGTDITTGSSAVLLAHLLRLAGHHMTIVPTTADIASAVVPGAAAFFIGCPEPQFIDYPFPSGSVVIDPWQRVQARESVAVHWIGSPRRGGAEGP
jgi:UDPglucose 6-dehydrogenase